MTLRWPWQARSTPTPPVRVPTLNQAARHTADHAARAPRLRVEPVLLPPGEAFTPTQPKPGRRQIVGRQAELQRIVQALREEKAHVVLYTERGRGKTSLANLVIEALRQGGVIVARHACEAGSSFDSIMRGLLRDLPRALLATPANDPSEVGCEAALPQGTLRPRDVVGVMARLTCRTLVCVVDEFDRVEDEATRTRLADTVKQLSDQAVPLSFMVVGVSENLEQILGQHPSIQRNLVAVQLPLLTDAEVASVIETGARQAGFTLFESAVEYVAALSRGSPYMAQLMGLRLIQATRERGSAAVAPEDFAAAITRLLNETSPRTKAIHASLTQGGSDPEMVRTLAMLAMAEQDSWGRFKVMPSFRDGVSVGQTYITAERWARILASQVVRPAGEGYGLHAFAERSVMHHILLLAARDAPAEAKPDAGRPAGRGGPVAEPAQPGQAAPSQMAVGT